MNGVWYGDKQATLPTRSRAISARLRGGVGVGV